jgi:hypothetical protein
MTPHKLSSGILVLEKAMRFSQILSLIKTDSEITTPRLWYEYQEQCQIRNVKPATEYTFVNYIREMRTRGLIIGEKKVGNDGRYTKVYLRKVAKENV